MAARSSGARNDGGGGGAQGEPPLRAREVLRRPELFVDDAVHVAVVLAEVAGRVLQVPEEVRPAVVPAKTPDVPLGVILEHAGGTAADVVHVVDLPRRV